MYIDVDLYAYMHSISMLIVAFYSIEELHTELCFSLRKTYLLNFYLAR